MPNCSQDTVDQHKNAQLTRPTYQDDESSQAGIDDMRGRDFELGVFVSYNAS